MLQQNPQLASSFMQDQKMMQLIISLLGINANVTTPDEMMKTEPTPAPAKEPEPVVQEVVSDEVAAERAKRAESNKEKDLGNQEYKKRSFEKALVHYDKAFELDGTNVAVLTNKSGTFLVKPFIRSCTL